MRPGAVSSDPLETPELQLGGFALSVCSVPLIRQRGKNYLLLISDF